jgi:hypothetical protein
MIRVRDAAILIDMSTTTLRRLRQSGAITEGCHYIRYGKKDFRYLSEALWHWAQNQHQPKIHQDWLASKFVVLEEGDRA